jgi:hypothetical protein
MQPPRRRRKTFSDGHISGTQHHHTCVPIAVQPETLSIPVGLTVLHQESTSVTSMRKCAFFQEVGTFLLLCVYFTQGQTTGLQEARRSERVLQVMDRFQIGESKIVFTGTVIELIYPLNDLVADGSVSTTLFSDRDCSVDISGNDYLVPTIVFDENPNPDGTKNREVTVRYDVDPIKVQETDVWLQDETNQFFISFCMGIHLHDGDAEAVAPSASLDTVIKLQVDLMGGFGVELPVE